MSSMKRSLKSRQIQAVIVSFAVSGTAVTPAASGMDAALVDSVTDNGTGDYTILLKEKAQLDLVPVGVVSLTAGAVPHISAIDEESFTVEFTDDAGAAIDANFQVTLMQRFSKHTF